MKVEIIVFLVIILAVFIFGVIFFLRNLKSNLTMHEIEIIRNKYIIRHKEQFPKIVIQKAQQFLDNL